MVRNKNFRLFLLMICGILFLASAWPSGMRAQSTDPDAIAVRVVPNLNHFSISRWYESQGFQGSPQSLTVDGYEAIRDGRTIYVNAAEVDQDSKMIYSNIYIISYNQNPAAYTVDILGQIISHWKFNNNIWQNENPAPTCSISSLSCASKNDCGADQSCVSTGVASGSCALVTPKNCADDSDCPANFFCSSLKSQVTRDLKRLGKLEDLKKALYNYKNANGSYPLLAAGTYLANRSISSWPSWSENLLSDLAVAQNFFDPINRLGACPGYDQKTCWNATTHKYVFAPTGSDLTLPAGSYAFVYSTNNSGSIYKVCATLESRASGYHFSSNDPLDSACVVENGVISNGQSSNTPPQLIEKSLSGLAGREFNGFVRVSDKENDTLSWSIDTSGTNWAGWKNGGKNDRPPVLVNTSNPNQKKIYAQNAPSISGSKTYNLKLIVNDGEGGVLTTTTPIVISSSLPIIEAADEEYVLDPIVPFNYSFYISGDNVKNSNFSILRTAPANGYHILSNMHKTVANAGPNKYKITYQGIVPTSNKFYQDLNSSYRVTVTDSLGNVAKKDFTIKAVIENPYLNFSCLESARINYRYDCLLGQTNQGNHSITYTATGLPSGFVIGGANLSGLATATGTYAVMIKATNEYGASTTKSLVLKTNSYCGDGILQNPNSEGRGGKYNDGYEDCDGFQGVVASTTLSSIDRQYGCQTAAGVATPNPILSNDQCVFKSPLKGGGYCGDGYCQAKIGSQDMENCLNCQQDCGNCQMTIESYSNAEQIAYFNGSRIYKTVGPNKGQATRTALTGPNIISFWIHNLSTTTGTYGLSYNVLLGPTSTPFEKVTTSNSSLRCALASNSSHNFSGTGLSGDDYDPAGELVNAGFKWPELNFNETSSFASSTVLSRPNSPFGTPYVWGSPYSNATSAFYCRLYYNYSPDIHCRPQCQGVPTGSPDGCGGTCQTANCTPNCVGKNDNEDDGCGGLCCTPDCAGHCAGQREENCGTICPDTGTNNGCPYGFNNIPCRIAFAWNYYTGTTNCLSDCSGYDRSTCVCVPSCDGQCNGEPNGCGKTCQKNDVCVRDTEKTCAELHNGDQRWKGKVTCKHDCSGYDGVDDCELVE